MSTRKTLSPQADIIKIVVPDAGPINTLAAAGLLDLLLAPENTRLVLVDEVKLEIVSRSSELAEFCRKNRLRIDTITTDTGRSAQAMRELGRQPGKNAGEMAAVEFIMYQVDAAVGNAPAFIVYEDKKLPRLHALHADCSKKAHIITMAAYLRKLAEEEIIDSFEFVWARVVQANASMDLRLHREPSSEASEQQATTGSRIRFGRKQGPSPKGERHGGPY